MKNETFKLALIFPGEDLHFFVNENESDDVASVQLYLFKNGVLKLLSDNFCAANELQNIIEQTPSADLEIKPWFKPIYKEMKKNIEY